MDEPKQHQGSGWLVLSRRVGEEIIIDGKIRVKLNEIVTDKKVRLAILAPANVVIIRAELEGRKPK